MLFFVAAQVVYLTAMIFLAFKLNIGARQIGRNFLPSFRDLRFAKGTVNARNISRSFLLLMSIL